MLSTYTVTSLAGDYSAGTLLSEIADAPAGPQTIVFSPALAGGTVHLPADTTPLLDHPSGQLTIQASAGTTVTIEGTVANAGVLMVTAGTTAELDGLIITGGNTNGNGGGIDNDGTLILNDCTVTGNVADGNGGGIANEAGATAIINDSTITNNTAHGGGASEPIQVNGPTSASSNGSYSNDGDTFAAAFDGNTDTYFDAPGPDGNWIELDLGSPTLINEIAYAPRVGWESRMEGGVFYASNDPTFSNPSDIETLYVVGSTAPADGLTYQTVNTDNARYEFVRYNAPAGSYGNIAEMQVFNESGTTGGILSPLSGVPSANTLASYDDAGNDYLKAFDGSINTYFDSPDETGNWIQMDLGSNPPVIDQISYAPRADWESRMVGGTFQASNSANFSTGVVNLFTITATPVDGYTSEGVNPGAAYEYIRYQSPADSYGNIAEMQVYTMDGTGAGIYNAPNYGSFTNSLTVNNCTITGNIAPGRFGGAIAGGDATIDIVDSTISQNTGGGIAAEGTISINGSIAADNQGQDLSIDADSAGSYDLIGDGSGGLSNTSGSIFGTVTSPVDPLLGALENNGGLTDTMALETGSPAFQAGDDINDITTDQRGYPRPDDASPDIGAYQTLPADYATPVLSFVVQGSFLADDSQSVRVLSYGPYPVNVTPITMNFGDGSNETITTPPTYVDGEYAEWDLQHTFASVGTYTLTGTGTTPIGGENFEDQSETYTSYFAAPGTSVFPPMVYSYPASDPTLPTGSETFTPPTGSGAATSTAPEIAASNIDAQPDGTITLTGGPFTADANSDYADTRFVVYGQTNSSDGTMADALLQDTNSPNGVLATLPSNLPSGSMYLIWPEDAAGIGNPIAINQTTAQWIQPEISQPSATVSVYGRNLDNSSGQSWVYLQSISNSSSGMWAAVSTAAGAVNSYCVQFVLPSTIASGTYEVWVYNGEGGQYGWSESPTSLVVTSAPSHGSTINVQDYGVSPDNTAVDNGIALYNLTSSSQYTPTTFYFPAGTYNVDESEDPYPIKFYSNDCFQGATMNAASGVSASTINFVGDIKEDGPGSPVYFELGNDGSFGGPTNVEFDSIGLDYFGSGSGSILCDRFSDSGPNTTDSVPNTIVLNNTIIISNQVGAIDFESDTGVTLTNSFFVSVELFFNHVQNLTLNNDTFLQDYDPPRDTTGLVEVWYGNQDSITNCFAENYANYNTAGSSLGADGYGSACFIDFANSSDDIYVANNTSILGEGSPPVDPNSGSQILFEAPAMPMDVPVASAAAASICVSGSTLYDLATTYNENVNNTPGWYVDVLSGPAMGEHLPVSTISYDGTTGDSVITLSGTAAIIPTSGDISLDQAATNLALYQNTLTHTIDSNAGNDEAAEGIQIGDGGYGVALDDNTVQNTTFGFRLWADSTAEGPNNPLPSSELLAFADVINNTITVVQAGDYEPVGIYFPDYGHSGQPDPSFYGINIAGNNINQSTVIYNDNMGPDNNGVGIGLPGYRNDAYINVPDNESQPGGRTFIDVQGNTITGLPIALETADDSDTLVYKNTFNSGSGTYDVGTDSTDNPGPGPDGAAVAIYFQAPYQGASSDLLLQSNNYIGYASGTQYFSPTGDPLPDPTLEIPHRVAYLICTNGVVSAQSLALQDEGTSDIAWTTSTSSSWLSFQNSSGTTAAESSSSSLILVVDPAGLTSGSYWSTVTISYTRDDATVTLEADIDLIVQ